MNINFYFKNIEPTEAIKNYVSEKLQKVEERLHHVQAVNVRFLVEREKQICEVSIQAEATMFHVKKINTDLYAAIDNVVDTLNIQIDKHHKKMDSKNPHVSAEGFPYFEQEPIDEENPISFYNAAAKPMTNLEAITQLQMEKYKFFMFHLLDSKRYSLVYLRPDGLYSIVTPTAEFGQYKDHVVKLKDNELHDLSVSLFPMSILTLAEAVSQLEDNQMEYIVFVNEDTRRMNVLFHEKNGTLALKQPQV